MSLTICYCHYVVCKQEKNVKFLEISQMVDMKNNVGLDQKAEVLAHIIQKSML